MKIESIHPTSFIPARCPFTPELPAFVPNQKPIPRNHTQCRRERIENQKRKTMKRKHLFLALAALIAAAGLWLARSGSSPIHSAPQQSAAEGADFQSPSANPNQITNSA